MEQQILKKGRLQKIDHDTITIFNTDGNCEDTLNIIAEDADAIRQVASLGDDVFYIVEGNRLLGVGAEEFAPENIRFIYDMMEKQKGCISAA